MWGEYSGQGRTWHKEKRDRLVRARSPAALSITAESGFLFKPLPNRC